MCLPCTVARNPEVQVACGVRWKVVEPLRVIVERLLVACPASATSRAAVAAADSGAPDAPPVPPVPPVPGVVAEPVPQRELSITLLIRLTWPVRASRRPITVAPLFS